MSQRNTSYIIDLNSDKYSQNFKNKFVSYLEQVKRLEQEFLMEFDMQVSQADLMGTIAAKICPDLKKRLSTPQPGEKRGANTWNAFRHAYKDVYSE